MNKKKATRRLSRKELERMEGELDLADALKAMEEEGPNVPWEQVKEEFGL